MAIGAISGDGRVRSSSKKRSSSKRRGRRLKSYEEEENESTTLDGVDKGEKKERRARSRSVKKRSNSKKPSSSKKRGKSRRGRKPTRKEDEEDGTLDGPVHVTLGKSDDSTSFSTLTSVGSYILPPDGADEGIEEMRNRQYRRTPSFGPSSEHERREYERMKKEIATLENNIKIAENERRELEEKNKQKSTPGTDLKPSNYDLVSHVLSAAENERREYERMKHKIMALENNFKIAENERRKFERRHRQKSTLEKELMQANDDLVSKDEYIMSKEGDVDDLTRQISKLKEDLERATKENDRLAKDRKEIESSMNAINDDLDRAVEENESLLNKCDTFELDALEAVKKLERAKVEAEFDKKSLAQKHSAEKEAKEDAEARCLELEKLLEDSKKENKDLTNLLRQKTSKIRSMDRTVDEAAELREKALEYDCIVSMNSQLEAEVSETNKANKELTEEIQSLEKEITKLNASLFDADLDRQSLEKQLEVSTHENKDLAALLRQKSSCIKSLEKTTNEAAELREKLLEYDCMVNLNAELKAEVSEANKINKEQEEEIELLENEITKLNSSIFDANLDRDEQTEELQNAQKENEKLAELCKGFETKLKERDQKISSLEKNKKRRQDRGEQRKHSGSFDSSDAFDEALRDIIQDSNLQEDLEDMSIDTDGDYASVKEEDEEEEVSHDVQDTKPTTLSDAEMRALLIKQELKFLVKTTNETELNEDIDENTFEALKKGAMKICFLNKYYDVMKDEFIYLPSVARTFLDYSLLEAAETFYTKEGSFPADISAALRSVAADTLKEDGDDVTDEDYAGLLASPCDLS